MSGRREVLVITVPKGSVKVEDFPRFREYIIESILRDVLVLDESMASSIQEVPEITSWPVAPVAVVKEDTKTTEPTATASMKEKKQKILQRLIERREKKGAGAFNDVARECRSKGVTTEILRKLVAGDVVLQHHEWLSIERALDKVEEREAKESG